MEYRQPVGFDATLNIRDPNVFTGVLIRLVPGPGYENTRYTHILDFNPVTSPASFDHATLLAGQSWTDPYSPLSIKVNTPTSAGIGLTISFDQPCVSVTSSLVSASGGTAVLSVVAPNSCAWAVSSNTSWLQVQSGASGNGNGTIVLKVDPNLGIASRNAVLSVGREVVTVVQSALQPQTITFAALSPVVLGVGPFPLSATASSGLVVTLTSKTPGVCSVADNTVAVIAVGTCSITAMQAGNATYLAATVIRTFAVFSVSPLNDTFASSSVDAAKWSVVVLPAGSGTITATDHGVQMLQSASGAALYLGLQSRWKLTGDFDVQVDFSLVSWPPQNYHTIRMYASDLPGSAGQVGVYRNSYGGEGYQMRTASGVAADVAVSDTGGKLRLARAGTTISGYYWDGNQFVLLASSSATADDTGIAIDFSAGTTSPSGTPLPSNVSVTLGNFGVTIGTWAGAPVIEPGGVSPIYSSSTTIEPGSWVWIFGSNFSQTTRSWNSATEIVNGKLPTSLDGVRVSIDNKPAYVYYISPGQINVQAPDDTTTGPVSVVVTNLAGTGNAVTVTLGSAGPSFFTYGDQYALGVIPSSTGVYGPGLYDLLGPSGRYSFNTRPAKVGEVVSLYGTGFGATNPPTPAGVVISPPYGQTSLVTVSIGGVSQTVNAYVTAAGEWQINATIPSVPSGDQPLQATVGVLQTLGRVFISVQ
jgi:uncharacterized protein (TIGR03437 family)